MAKNKRKKSVPAAEPVSESPGWDAITAACERLYPDQKNPLHFAPAISPIFGDGLIYGISGYKATNPNHWHIVTYGFSDLYAKESDDPAVSGWGFELTFRTTRKREKHPPHWAINFLTNLGTYVRRSGNPFGAGHTMDLNGPICLGSDTAIRAIAFARDCQLGTIDTPNGSVEFLQVVGLTLDENEACGNWHTSAVLDVMRETDPLLVTDLSRRSILEDRAAAKRIQTGIDIEGSQSDRGYVALVEWTATGRGSKRTAALILGANGVISLMAKLQSRLAHGRDFMLVGREQGVRFCMGKRAALKTDAGLLTVTLTPEALEAVRGALKPVRGHYVWPELPGLTLNVQPSQITDPDGKVIEVIG